MIAVIPMQSVHLKAVHGIESHSFSDPWPLEEIHYEMNQSHSIGLVAMEAGKVIGYTIMRHIEDEGHICNIAVHEDHRQKGVGSAIISALINIAKTRNITAITLEVRIGNRAAMALYHKYGFKVEGYRKGFYRHPTEDAAIMWKYIADKGGFNI